MATMEGVELNPTATMVAVNTTPTTTTPTTTMK